MRSYGQFCPIARGSEILAERWTPIILRNVLGGANTFNDIADGAPGLSRALLTRRLHELERHGVITIRPKPTGRGSLYEPTTEGRELWPVLRALGDWAEQWLDVTAEHSDPGVVLWSWSGGFLRRDLLPERRIVVRFDSPHRGKQVTGWLLIERGEAEVCLVDPRFGDDLIVTITDPVAFARWHLGLLEWASALRSGAIRVNGPRDLRRALPTWNAGPQIHTQLRAAHQRTPDSPPIPHPLPPVDAGKSRAVSSNAPRRRPKRSNIAGFDGQLVTPDDPGYDRARSVWNGAIDRRPRCIAQCRSPSDVTAALRYGRARDLTIRVRGGGHGVTGTAVCDDGLVIDLGPMKRITVDPATTSATVQAGVIWRELDAASQAFGLATTGGAVSHIGVAGLTLGGGLGWLMRRHGLTVDNVLSVEVLTADGQHLIASDKANPDLFWGLRGGGGGLGIVTSLTYRLHPVGPEVLAGPVLWSLEDAPEVLRAYREYVATAPREVTANVTLRRAPRAPFLPVELHGRPVCQVSLLALAEPDKATRLLAPIRTFGRPLLDLVKHRPYTNLQSMTDATVPHGWHYYWKSAGLREIDDEVLETMVEHAGRSASPWSFAQLLHLGGAVADVTPDATAYSRRDVPHELHVSAVWQPHESIGGAESDWARSFIADVEPQHSGAYLNFLDHDDNDRTPSAFSPAADARLGELKSRFDPDRVLQPQAPD